MTGTRKLLAWLVHLYTAMGFVCAAGIAVLIVRGGDPSFRWAFILMMVATAIDATDGWLARKARVKEVLPGFDGRALDDLIDFHTYTSLPLLLLWRAGMLPDGLAWLVVLGWVLLGPASDRRTLAIVSLIYPLTYLTLSAAVTVRVGRAPAGGRTK
jgi:phosphatidylserine synthase